MFGIWIFLAGQLSPRFDPIALTAAQLAIFAVLAIPVVLVGGLGHITGQVIVAVLITGIACSTIRSACSSGVSAGSSRAAPR